MNSGSAKKWVILSYLAVLAVITLSEFKVSKEMPNPGRYTGATFAFVVIGFAAEAVPAVASAFAILFAMSVILKNADAFKSVSGAGTLPTGKKAVPFGPGLGPTGKPIKQGG